MDNGTLVMSEMFELLAGLPAKTLCALLERMVPSMTLLRALREHGVDLSLYDAMNPMTPEEEARFYHAEMLAQAAEDALRPYDG